MADGGGLENRYGVTPIVGSNPTPSARRSPARSRVAAAERPVRSYVPPMRRLVTGAVASLVVVAGLAVAPAAMAAPSDRATDVAEHWTPERVAAAEPRDLLVDERGLGYERRGNGRLTPHGHSTAAEIPAPTAVPSAEPVRARADAARQAERRHRRAVHRLHEPGRRRDGRHVRHVLGHRDRPQRRPVGHLRRHDSAGGSSSFPASGQRQHLERRAAGLHRRATGPGRSAPRTPAATRTTSAIVAFTVGQPAPAPPGDSTVVANARGRRGGAVQNAAGRIYFEMPRHADPRRAGRATSARARSSTDATTRPLDDPHRRRTASTTTCNKAFARNVLFIPNQAGTTGTRHRPQLQQRPARLLGAVLRRRRRQLDHAHVPGQHRLGLRVLRRANDGSSPRRGAPAADVARRGGRHADGAASPRRSRPRERPPTAPPRSATPTARTRTSCTAPRT